MGEKVRWHRFLLLGLVLLLGAGMRYESAKHTEVIKPLSPDACEYVMYAYNLRHKGVYSSDARVLQGLDAPVEPDAVRNPGYPLFLMPFMDDVPNRGAINNIVLAQALISTLTMAVSFFLFEAFLPFRWALGATLLTSLSPHLIVMNSYVLTETLFCFLIVLSAWTISLFWSRSSSILMLATGFILGLSALVHPSIEYFILFPAVLLFKHHGLKKGMRFCSILVLGFAIALAPWIIRNMVSLGTAADDTLMIGSISHGMYPNLTFEGKPESYGFPYRYDPRRQEITGSFGSVVKEIKRRFTEQPARHLVWFLIGKPLAFWEWDNGDQGMGDAFHYEVSTSPYFDMSLFRISHFFMHGLHWSLVFLGFFACLMTWFPLSVVGVATEAILTARFISLLLVYFAGIHVIGAPLARYSIPLRPFMYGMALFLPYILFRMLTQRSSEKSNACSSRK